MEATSRSALEPLIDLPVEEPVDGRVASRAAPGPTTPATAPQEKPIDPEDLLDPAVLLTLSEDAPFPDPAPSRTSPATSAPVGTSPKPTVPAGASAAPPSEPTVSLGAQTASPADTRPAKVAVAAMASSATARLVEKVAKAEAAAKAIASRSVVSSQAPKPAPPPTQPPVLPTLAPASKAITEPTPAPAEDLGLVPITIQLPPAAPTPAVVAAAAVSAPAATGTVVAESASPPPAETVAAAAPIPVVAPAVASPAPSTSPLPSTGTTTAGTAQPGAMDRDFIARNQIVERYLSGRLPLKGATDFERFCRDNPQLLDDLGLPERVNAGLRLLEASGKPEPWQEAPPRAWARPQIFIGLVSAVLVLGAALVVVASSSAAKSHQLAKLQKQAADQPLDPATSTRAIRLLPSRDGAVNSPAVVIGGGPAQLVDFKIDETRSPYKTFRITIDRADQGRVGVIHNLVKDSNGHLRIVLNTTALGPGNYQLTIEGLSWRGDPEPDSWITIGIQR